MSKGSKKILLSGSIAYDYLYKFPGVFQDRLLNEQKGHLSVAFGVKDKCIHFGGCAGNTAYNAQMVGMDFIMIGIVGRDFEQYENWLKKNRINTDFVIRDNSYFTSQATVTTDKLGQQITFFYEGAAENSKNHSGEISKMIGKLAPELLCALVSPNNHDFMLQTINSCIENRVPFFFDPGQALPSFSASELLNIINHSRGVFLNEYEFNMLKSVLKLDLKEFLRLCPLVVVTLAEKGSKIYFNEEVIEVPTKQIKNSADPTGCGDAYRAGFLAEIAAQFPHMDLQSLTKAGQAGTLLALACLKSSGTQNHVV
ncbi:MAG: carbohydrate kinase family protein [Candidatus Gracilibacteria bacterium]